MTSRTDYSAVEWQVLVAAPAAASQAISFADPSGPPGMYRESAALVQALNEASVAADNALVQQLAQANQTQQATPKHPNTTGGTPPHLRLIEHCQRAVAIVAQQSPADAAALTAWLLAIAHTTAEAAKEATILGVGGTPVSAAERAALQDLATALERSRA
jgi:hypothetical protein